MRVVVIGAGIIGAACALALTEAGAEVVIVDRVGVAGETSSRCEGNLLLSDKAPGPEAELAIASILMWRNLATRLDEYRPPEQPATEYEPKGGIVVAFAGGEVALRRFAAAQRGIGIRSMPMSRAELIKAEPFISHEVVGAIHYPDDAQVQPSCATQALFATALRGGAQFIVAEVIGALGYAERISGVRTTVGSIEADVVVNCTGPWAGEVATRLGTSLDIRPRRGVLLVTTPMPQRIFHKVYDSDYVGAVNSGDAALQTSTVIESTVAGTVLIGSSREQVGFDQHPGMIPAAMIAAKAVRLFPFLSETMLLRSYFGFRPYSPDHLPVIGFDPCIAGLVHATGHEGSGIGLAPATAELVAHTVLGIPTNLNPAPFLPGRPTLKETA